MTAQIIIMNKEGIALASDSALTSTRGADRKIFTSANKLFALSKYQPVGIMVSGSAACVGVPWETVIKIHRKELGRKEFASLDDYADNFITFLGNNNLLFPENVQENYFAATIFLYFKRIKDEILKVADSVITKEGSISDKDWRQLVSQIISKYTEQLRKAQISLSTPKKYRQEIIGKFNTLIDKVLKDIFEKVQLSKSDVVRLKNIAADLSYKFPEDFKLAHEAGVVIAGFGRDDYFPVVKHFTVELIINNRVKYTVGVSKKISAATLSSIIPFAQRDVVDTFMEGVDPSLKKTEESYLSELIKKCIERVVDEVEGLDGNQTSNLKVKMNKIGNEEIEQHRKKLAVFRKNRYITPVVNVISVLPKDELAAVAESLVNLTSFKRKVSMQLETVGGPIDVAVISKGDGFIWIKRKHYFTPELNPQFLAKYFREVSDEQQKEEEE